MCFVDRKNTMIHKMSGSAATRYMLVVAINSYFFRLLYIVVLGIDSTIYLYFDNLYTYLVLLL